jgi:hypothetical protein
VNLRGRRLPSEATPRYLLAAGKRRFISKPRLGEFEQAKHRRWRLARLHRSPRSGQLSPPQSRLLVNRRWCVRRPTPRVFRRSIHHDRLVQARRFRRVLPPQHPNRALHLRSGSCHRALGLFRNVASRAISVDRHASTFDVFHAFRLTDYVSEARARSRSATRPSLW